MQGRKVMASRKNPIRLRSAFFVSTAGLSLTLMAVALGLSTLGEGRIDIFLLLFIPTVILALVLAKWQVNRHIKPLERLMDKIIVFADGDYSVKFETDEGTKEVQDMSRALDEIGRAVNRSLQIARKNEENQKQFVSDVSHELRTPLTALRGTAETMREDPEMPLEDREHFLDTMISECDRLTRLANDLLTLQRVENGTLAQERERLDLRDIVDDVLSLLAALFEERGVNVEVVGSALPVYASKDSLAQVVVNLLENASRFSEAGDTVTVRLSSANGRSILSVEDQGPGFGDINPQILFNRFYLGDSSRRRQTKTGGTGLGLSIVKSIVLLHGGTVEAFNLPERGACFIVALPSCDEESVATLPINPGMAGGPTPPVS